MMKVSTKFEVDMTIRCLYSYSVIAADTLRDLVTLVFDLLTFVCGHAWRVRWSTHPPPSLKIIGRSSLDLWVKKSPMGYHWQCVCRLQPLRMRRITWPTRKGKYFPHIWNLWPRFAYSLR